MSAGDIASNPGPALNTPKNKRMRNRNISAAICPSCEKTVRKKSKACPLRGLHTIQYTFIVRYYIAFYIVDFILL